MYDENQLVEAKWNGANKKHFIECGYSFTKMNDVFLVRAKDLPKASKIVIKAKCDYCGKEKEIPKSKYYDNTNGFTRKFSCADKNCTYLKNKEYRYDAIIKENYKKVCKLCSENNYSVVSPIEEYAGSHKKIKILCHIHGEFEKTPVDLFKGSMCPNCSIERQKENLKLDIKDVIRIVESKNNDKILNPQNYINANTKNLIIECGSCGNTFLSSLSNIQNSKGHCIDCARKITSNSIRFTSEQVENIINSNGNLLLNSDEYVNYKTKLKILCSCGNQYTTSLANYLYNNVTRCKTCSRRISSGELLIKGILEELQVSFEEEKRFENCRNIRPLPFDFYLPDYNTCIEFDGQLHFEQKEKFGGKEALEKRQYLDSLKTNYCNDNNILLIRIPYWKSRKAKDIIINELKLKNNV